MRLRILLLPLWMMGTSSPGEEAKPNPPQDKTPPFPPHIMRGIEYAAKGLRTPEEEERLKKTGQVKAEGVETPESYRKKINPLIGAIWSAEVRKINIAAQLKAETAEFRFLLDAKGKLISIRTISKNVTPAFAATCEDAVRQTAKDFPPVPPELLDAKSKTFEAPISFSLY